MKKYLFILIALTLVFGVSLAWQQTTALAQDAAPPKTNVNAIRMNRYFFMRISFSFLGTI